MMLSFQEGDKCFNYRVAGVAVREDSVLLQQAEGDYCWVFPGGRPEFGEPAEQTLKREMREEIGVEVEVVRLLWLVENFFTYADRRYHEITLYFLMRLPETCVYSVEPGPFAVEDEGTKLTFRWVPRRPEVLSGLPLLPSFLQTSLRELPATVRHVTHTDG